MKILVEENKPRCSNFFLKNNNKIEILANNVVEISLISTALIIHLAKNVGSLSWNNPSRVVL